MTRGRSDRQVPASLSPHLFNAVGRLWGLLVAVRTRGPDDAPASSGVADYLELDPASALARTALAAVYGMPEQARAVLAGVEPPPDLPLASLDGALTEAAAATALLAASRATLGEVRECYGPSTLTTLKGTSAWLIGASIGTQAGTAAALEAVRRCAQEVATAAGDLPDLPAGLVEDLVLAVLGSLRILPLTGPGGLARQSGRVAGLFAHGTEAGAAIRASARLERALRALAESLQVLDFGRCDAIASAVAACDPAVRLPDPR